MIPNICKLMQLAEGSVQTSAPPTHTGYSKVSLNLGQCLCQFMVKGASYHGSLPASARLGERESETHVSVCPCVFSVHQQACQFFLLLAHYTSHFLQMLSLLTDCNFRSNPDAEPTALHRSIHPCTHDHVRSNLCNKFLILWNS